MIQTFRVPPIAVETMSNDNGREILPQSDRFDAGQLRRLRIDHLERGVPKIDQGLQRLAAVRGAESLVEDQLIAPLDDPLLGFLSAFGRAQLLGHHGLRNPPKSGGRSRIPG